MLPGPRYWVEPGTDVLCSAELEQLRRCSLLQKSFVRQRKIKKPPTLPLILSTLLPVFCWKNPDLCPLEMYLAGITLQERQRSRGKARSESRMKSSVQNLDDSVQLSCFSEPILILQNIKSKLVKSNVNCINEHVLLCQKLETWSPFISHCNNVKLRISS